MDALSHIISIPFGSDNTGEYSVLRFFIVPPCGRANTATLELNIPLVLPSKSCNIIHLHRINQSDWSIAMQWHRVQIQPGLSYTFFPFVFLSFFISFPSSFSPLILCKCIIKLLLQYAIIVFILIGHTT